jgi:hypothetical protein
VVPYRDPSYADRANATHSAFGLGVGADADVAADIAARFECGTAWVNRHLALAFQQPFGGLQVRDRCRELTVGARRAQRASPSLQDRLKRSCIGQRSNPDSRLDLTRCHIHWTESMRKASMTDQP